MSQTVPPSTAADPAEMNIRPVVAMLLYRGFTLLDLVGPHAVLNATMEVRLVAKTLDPVMSDSGVAMKPTHTFADASTSCDVLFVPGGAGTADAIADAETVDYLARVGADARYVTSVCSGSLVLGAAGLLDGYRAGCHWSALELLPSVGADPVAQRVVVDRNRVTGGGVTAGLDFGLTLLAEMQGQDTARLTQLMMEYDPQPPFDSGSPTTATAELVNYARALIQPVNTATVAALAGAKQRRQSSTAQIGRPLDN